MPTNRIRRRHERRQQYEGLTAEVKRALLRGRSFFDKPSLEILREAWEQHGGDLREEWAANNPPGTRCFGEWLFDLIPRYGERRTTRYWREKHERRRAEFLNYGILHTHTIPRMQEPEAAYLHRNDLLTDEERRLVSEAAVAESCWGETCV